MLTINPGDYCIQVSPKGRCYMFRAGRVTQKCVFISRGRRESREDRETIRFATPNKELAERLHEAICSRADYMARIKREAREDCEAACQPHLQTRDNVFEDAEDEFASDVAELIQAASK